ncbi:MAG: DUF2079 domain-containing protein [Planctomycetes bacterium]|nr:DUF2079 domain-containing protein [Planctomycetota bacterium]
MKPSMHGPADAPPSTPPSAALALSGSIVAAGGAFAGLTFDILQHAFASDGSLECFAASSAAPAAGLAVAALLWLLLSRERSRGVRIPFPNALVESARVFLPLLLLVLPPLERALGAARARVGWSALFLLALSAPLGVALAPYLVQRIRSGRLVLGAGVALFTVAFSWVGLERYACLEWGYSDSGCIAEVLHNTLSGRFLHTNALPFGNYLGDHFSPVLFLILPIYALAPAHETLIILHAAAIGLGAVPVFLLARRATGSASCATAMALAYLLFPPVQMQTTNHSYGFKCSSLSIPFLLWAIDCAWARRTWALLAFCLLALSCEESAAAAVFMLGVWAALRGPAGPGILIAAAALSWFFAATRWIMPAINEARYVQMSLFYGHLGSSASEILAYLLTHPAETLGRVFQPKAFHLALHLLTPLALLPLLRPHLLLLGLPTFLFLCLSRQEAFLWYQYQYKATLIPFVFLAASAALASVPPRIGRWLGSGPGGGPRSASHLLASMALCASALSCVFFGNLPVSWVHAPITEHHRAAAAVAAQAKEIVPHDAAILCSERLASHFTDRRDLFRIRNVPGAAFDFAAFDLLSDWPLSKAEHEILLNLLEEGLFQPVLAEEGIVVLQKGGRSPPELQALGPSQAGPPGTPAAVFPGLGRLYLQPVRAEGGDLRVPAVWEALGRSDRPYLAEVSILTPRGPLTRLFPIGRGLWPPTRWEAGQWYPDAFRFRGAGDSCSGVRVRPVPPPAYAGTGLDP